MTVDWQNGPAIQAIKELKLVSPTIEFLDNGIKVLTVNGESRPITKIDIVFKGARWLEEKKVTARFVSALLREGTNKYSALDIAETLDFCGANIKSSSNLDFNYISFSCLNRHLDTILPLIAEIVLDPTFSEDEIDRFRNKSLNNLALDLARNELNCYREFTAMLYGEDHPYGYNTTKEALNSIQRSDLVYQYSKSFNSDNCFIIVTGNPHKDLIKDLNTRFGQFNKTTPEFSWIEPNLEYQGVTSYFNTKNELQSAIKLGRRVVKQNHSDYPALFVLNTLLGGYFGSRLMSTIREDKGLTYNIYSTIDNLKYDGYFYIATEVANETVDEVLDAIYEEINKLKAESVKQDELKMVKSYITGNFLSLVDGSFNIASLLRSLEIENRTLADFEAFYRNISIIEESDLRSIAQKYLDLGDFGTVIVKSNSK